MLDWSKIDNDKTFQRMISQLVALECNTPVFYPSSPYIGADGGYDTYLEGYSEEKLDGKICIQVKYSKHTLKNLYDILLKAIPTELQKAKNNVIEHLILVTNGELSVPYINELLKLANDTGINLYIWDREKLEYKISKQPFLRWFYFGNPAVPLFVPADVYFSEVEKNLIQESITDQIASVKNVVERFKLFIVNENERIFVVHAPGGYGKSHLTREIPTIMKEMGLDREIWYVRYGVRNFQEAFNDEIGSRESSKNRRKYIVVLDDVDRIKDFSEIITCVIKSGIDIKLVLALRSAGIYSLEESLMEARSKQFSVITQIQAWTDAELKILLHSVAQKEEIHDIDEIIRRYPNPYFLVRIGLNMRGRAEYNFESFKQEIIQSLINDSKKAIQSNQEITDKLLLHLSLISPVNINDKAILTKLAKKFNITIEQVETILQRLEKVGVLRSIGDVLRFIPDMVGDVYLFEKMKSLDERERNETFLYWFDTHSRNMFCNLGATLMYGEEEYLTPIINDVLNGWINSAKKYDDYEKRHILDNLEDICKVVPQRTIDLLWTFLKQSPLSTDDYGPVIIRLIYSKCSRESLIGIIEGLREGSALGTYDNYKPNSLVKELASPLGKNIEKQIIPILSFIEKRFDNNEVAKYLKMIVEVLSETLASAHEYTRSHYHGMEIGSKALLATKPVIEMRQQAISILSKMLLHTDPKVRAGAIDVIEDIGKNRSFPFPSKVPLYKIFEKERNEIIDFIMEKNLVAKETEWSVRSQYEDLLLNFWAHNEVLDAKIFTLLDQFNYDSEYRIFRYYASRLDTTESVREKLKEAPTQDRWKWFVDNIMQRKWKLSVDDFKADADYLDERYSEPGKVVSFLKNLDSQTTISSANALFLMAWFRKNPVLFKEIRLNSNYWDGVPLIFKYTISYEIGCSDSALALRIIKNVLFKNEILIEEAKVAIGMLECNLADAEKIMIINQIAKLNNNEISSCVMQKIRFIGGNFPVEDMASAINNLLASLNPDSYGVAVDNVTLLLYDKQNDYRQKFLEKTKNKLEEILLGRKSLEYHDNELIGLLFNNIDELFSFIEKRLMRDKEIDKYSSYQSIPFDGFPSIPKLIHDEKSYLTALNRILEWDERYTGSMHFSVSQLFEQLVGLEQSSGIFYLMKVKEEFFNKEKFAVLLNCLFKLPLDDRSIDFFGEIINKSTELGFEAEIAKLLRSKTYPEGGWSSKGDEIPPAFIMKKEVYSKLKNTAPRGLLRDTLDQCVNDIEKMIKHHIEEEKNRFYTR